MKLLWVFLTIFYAIIHQKHLAITADDTLEYLREKEAESQSEDQMRLTKDFGVQVIAVLRKINTPEFSLANDDPPLVQNYTEIYEDGLLDGLLLMYNVVIGGLQELDGGLDTNIVNGGREIQMAVDLKQLVIYGEFILEAPIQGTDDKGPFSVTLTNVRIKGVAYLVVNPFEDLVITKVVPTISSEESHISIRCKTKQLKTEILKSSLKHLQNTIEKRFANIAMLEVQNYHREERAHLLSTETWAMFEVRRFLSQRYDPHTFIIANYDWFRSGWRVSPIRLHGFSNIHLNDSGVIVTNDSVDIIVSFFANGLHCNFSYFDGQQGYLITLSVAQLDIIGKINLMAENSAKVPKLESMGMDMSGCRCSIRNKATGMPLDRNVFGFEAAGDNFCKLIQSEISQESIMKTIQSEIFNHMDPKRLEDSLGRVIDENSFLEEYYQRNYEKL